MGCHLSEQHIKIFLLYQLIKTKKQKTYILDIINNVNDKLTQINELVNTAIPVKIELENESDIIGILDTASQDIAKINNVFFRTKHNESCIDYVLKYVENPDIQDPQLLNQELFFKRTSVKAFKYNARSNY